MARSQTTYRHSRRDAARKFATLRVKKLSWRDAWPQFHIKAPTHRGHKAKRKPKP